MECKHCSAEIYKVIYAGFPMRLCSNKECNAIEGFWWWVATLVPVSTFVFFRYKGSYLEGVYSWFKAMGEIE